MSLQDQRKAEWLSMAKPGSIIYLNPFASAASSTNDNSAARSRTKATLLGQLMERMEPVLDPASHGRMWLDPPPEDDDLH